MKRIPFMLIALCLAFTSAEAKQRHHASTTSLHSSCNILWPCQASVSEVTVRESQRVARGRYVAQQMGIGAVVEHRAVRLPKPRQEQTSYRSPVVQQVAIVAHPAGCPSRAFCGCGAAVRVFGSPVRELWLAANWFKFPRTAPGPGMVAVRRHHVFVLEANLGNGIWQVYDANSGQHLTRMHARSIAGYAIVNPSRS